MLAERRDDRRALLGREAVRLEQIRDLHRLDIGLLLDLELLPLTLARVVFDVAAARQVATEPHRDRAGGDLGEAGGDDEPRRVDGAGDRCRQREGTVKPSDRPMTVSRTTRPPVK